MCEAKEVYLFARLAREYNDRFCCLDSQGQYRYDSGTYCSRWETEIRREECDENWKCSQNCNQVFYKSWLADTTDAEWSPATAQLKGLTKFEAAVAAGLTRTKVGNAFGYTAHIGSTIVIAFEGSQAVADSIAAGSVRDKQFSTGGETFYAARDFVACYSAIRQDVLTSVEQMAASLSRKGTPVREIIVTGHSVGGAMANLCALDMVYRFGYAKVSLWTFGAPRVFKGTGTKEHATGKLASALKGEPVVDVLE